MFNGFLYESNANWLAGAIVAVPEPVESLVLLLGNAVISAWAQGRRDWSASCG